MIPTNKKGKVLHINITCDLTKVMKEFRSYLERHSHGTVMEEEPDFFPHRPNEAYNRRDAPDWPDKFWKRSESICLRHQGKSLLAGQH